jgi:hypothetical protein
MKKTKENLSKTRDKRIHKVGPLAIANKRKFLSSKPAKEWLFEEKVTK